jgi:hypothetical protein
MSQSGAAQSIIQSISIVQSLTGNSGGAVGPDVLGNINVLGNNTSGINIIGMPGTNTLSVVATQATTTQQGAVTLATNAQAIAGTDTNNAITSDDLKAKLGVQTLHGLPIGAGTTAALTWTSAPTNGQLLIGSTGVDPVLGSLTSTSGTITITPGAGTINLDLAGGGIAFDQISVDASTPPGTNPVLPTAAGQLTLTGGQVASGTVGTNVIRSNSIAANSITLQIQRTTAVAATDISKNGVSHFDSADFTVDTNGFVSAATTGFIKTLTGNSGGAIAPVANNISTVGTGSITIAGAGSTLTTQLTGLTNHAVLIGAGTATITNVGPVAATGAVLMSNGAGSDPGFSTATYPLTTTVSQILYSSATNTVSGLATANNSVVLTDATGVPSLGVSLINDFTYTSSTAGGTRILTVTNTDNTNAASSALIKSVTGGASAGDGFYQASTTTTVWSFGVDNSVTSPTADPFVISQGTALGTNNIMSVATSGEINYPLQPAFLAYLASQANNKTGNGAAYTLGTDALTEVFDQNSDFNTNGTFTAPVTGRYQLSASCYYTGCTIATTFQLKTTTSNRTFFVYLAKGAAATDEQNVSSYLCDMDAADTATIIVIVSGEVADTVDIFGAATNPFTSFGGFLAC